MPIQTFLWSVNCTILFCKLCILFQTILDLLPVLILEIFYQLGCQEESVSILNYFFSCFFLVCKLYIRSVNQVCISSHILNMGNVLFEGFQYLVFQFLAFLSILSLFFLAIFPDLKMFKFWFVNYICQVCKLHFYFRHVQNSGQYLYLSGFSMQ